MTPFSIQYIVITLLLRPRCSLLCSILAVSCFGHSASSRGSLIAAASQRDGTVARSLLTTAIFIGKLGQIQRDRAARVRSGVTTDTDKALTTLVEHILKRNHNTLKVRLTTLTNVVANLAQID
jgi:hypothetical protein